MTCLICCDSLESEIRELINSGSIEVEPCFLDIGLHCDFDELEEKLKQTIEETQKKSSCTVVVYGDLCHPRIEKIIDDYDNVVKVNALNCIDCLLGGHGKILEIDPDKEYFYLSPGWMPSKLKKAGKFEPALDRSSDETKGKYDQLKGIILIDSLGNLSEFEHEIEKFSQYSGLPVLEEKRVDLENLSNLIHEAMNKLDRS